MISLSVRTKEAIKTGVAVVIAYAVALRMGWDNPFWPALTVITLNMMTTGQSLPRSMLRASGTLVGCVAALAILGLFPQSRWSFMVGLSVFVGYCAYMMKGKSYQYFWFLAAITCLIIPFKSLPLESQTAFEEAWLRTVETGAGAVIWILVAAFIWPRSSLGPFNQACAKLWATQAQLYRTYRRLMAGEGTAEQSRPLRLEEIALVPQVAQLLDAAEADSYDIWEARHQWRRFHEQSAALMQTLERWRQTFSEIQSLDLTRLLPNLEAVCTELDRRFEETERMLEGEAPTRTPQPITLAVDKAGLRALTRFQEAAVVVTKVQLDNLETLTGSLFACVAELGGYIRQAAGSRQAAAPRIGPSIDPDRMMAVMMVLCTLWAGFFIWVYIDPPMDSGFVMMAAIFALIMQLAPPAKASLQFMAWGSGAALGGVLYVFVMPHLSGYSELAVLIFAAYFAMYYLFGEPRLTLPRMLCMASFSILLIIDNQQTYSFSEWANMAAGLVVLPLTLAATVAYLTTSSHPDKNFLRLLRRFFRHAELLMSELSPGGKRRVGLFGRWRSIFYRNDLLEVPGKLLACSQEIDYRALPAGTSEQVQALVTRLYALSNRIKDLTEARALPQAEVVEGQLLQELAGWRQAIEARFQRRADDPTLLIEPASAVRDRLTGRMAGLETCVEETLARAGEGELSTDDLRNVYRLLGSYRGVTEAAIGYAELAGGIDWQRWQEPRF